MKKFILVLLLFVSTIGYAQESELESFENHVFRLYGSIGYGTQALNGGGGLAYAYEFGEVNSKKFMGLSVDMQVGSVGLPSMLFFNIQTSFGTGIRYKDGSRFYFDILGIGYSLVTSSLTEEMYGKHGYESVTGKYTSIGFLLNVLSFHYTTNNGFYLSWRNNIMLYSKSFLSRTYESGIVEKFNNSDSSFTFEYRTYVTVGFDFSKLYSPKNYQKRTF